MASFSDCPNEIISEIWTHMLELQDVENFAFVSKTVHLCAVPILRDIKKMKAESQIFRFWPYAPLRPIHLLEWLLVNPRHPFYVRFFTIDSWHDAWTRPNDYLGFFEIPHTPYVEKRMSFVKKAMRSSTYFRDNESEECITEIAKGDEDAIMALILWLLPNVDTIDIHGLGDPAPRFRTALRRLTETYNPRGRSPAVKVSFSQSEAWGGMVYPSLVTSVPAVKEIFVWDSMFNRFTDNQPKVRLPKSNVTKVFIVFGFIGLIWMSEFLSNIKALEEFSFNVSQIEEGASKLTPVVPILLAHTRKSLHTLVLRRDPDGYRSWPCLQKKFLNGLCEFECLRRLDVDSKFLIDFGSSKEKVQMAKQLPKSIETLTVQCQTTEGSSLIQNAVAQMVRMKKTHLPHLIEIVLVVGRGLFDSNFSQTTLIETTTAVGVNLILTTKSEPMEPEWRSLTIPELPDDAYGEPKGEASWKDLTKVFEKTVDIY